MYPPINQNPRPSPSIDMGPNLCQLGAEIASQEPDMKTIPGLLTLKVLYECKYRAALWGHFPKGWCPDCGGLGSLLENLC